MNQRIIHAAALACAALLLSACGGMSVNLWPLGGASEFDKSRVPAGANAYQCDGGKRLLVRYLDNGAAAWVILPEREFRLNKAASASGSRYTNGSATLDTDAGGATLRDGDALVYDNCKAAAG